MIMKLKAIQRYQINDVMQACSRDFESRTFKSVDRLPVYFLKDFFQHTDQDTDGCISTEYLRDYDDKNNCFSAGNEVKADNNNLGIQTSSSNCASDYMYK